MAVGVNVVVGVGLELGAGKKEKEEGGADVDVDASADLLGIGLELRGAYLGLLLTYRRSAERKFVTTTFRRLSIPGGML